MISILSLLFILGTSLVVTRIASVALEHTGLGHDAARFQARSAFTEVGLTTTEAGDLVGRRLGEIGDLARQNAKAGHENRLHTERQKAGR